MNLRSLLVVATILAPLPAAAWDARTGGSGPQSIGQDGGMAQSQQANASSRSSATGGKATVNFTYNDPPAAAGDPAGGYSGGSYAVRQAPDIFVPSVGGGGSDCPVVGFGAGGSGMGGGGGFGPSWISSRCDHRRYAEVIYALTGDRRAALEYLASVEPDVQKWLNSRASAQPAAAVVAAPLPPAAETLHGTSGADGYCTVLSAGERARHPECP